MLLAVLRQACTTRLLVIVANVPFASDVLPLWPRQVSKTLVSALQTEDVTDGFSRCKYGSI